VPAVATDYFERFFDPRVNKHSASRFSFLTVQLGITMPKQLVLEPRVAVPEFAATRLTWGAFVEAAQFGIALTDFDARLQTTNTAFESLVGYTRAELVGLTLVDLCLEDERDMMVAAFEALKRGSCSLAKFETTYQCKDQTLAPVAVLLSITTDPAQDQPLVLAVLVDISAGRRAEDALRAEQAELGRVARFTTVGAMTASIAHELRQPLAAIVTNGNAGLRWLDRPAPDLAEVRAALERMVTEGHRASEIISSIRAMFGKEQQQRNSVSIDDLIREVLSTLLGDLKSCGIALRLELLDGVHPVAADRVQLRQVLLNLVTNAMDAMKAVEDRPRVLRIRSEGLEQQWVVISVEDTGTGISAENKDRIFDAFFTTKSHGMGLGLSICRSIVEAHGGWLSASAAHPQGSTFQVMLPVEKPVGAPLRG
jgi:PAS domain S-box-containing protein